MKNSFLLCLISLTLFSCREETNENSSEKTEAKEKTIRENSISFSSNRDGNYEIYLMDSDGKNFRNISNHDSTDYWGSWSADGETLYFYSNRTGNSELFSMKADGSDVKQLTNDPANDYLPMISPDGTKILFSSNRDHSSPEIYVMDTDGSNIIRLTNNELFEESASWSPDGKKIIFTRELIIRKNFKIGTNAEIFIMGVDGKNEQQLTDKPEYDSGGTFSPDGNEIAFYGIDENHSFKLFIMDNQGGNQKVIVSDSLEYYSPSWSSDGKFIAYTKGNSKNYDIWKVEISTGKETRLTQQEKRDETPFWRPLLAE